MRIFIPAYLKAALSNTTRNPHTTKTNIVSPSLLPFTYLNLKLPHGQGMGECCLDGRKTNGVPIWSEER